MRRVKGWTRVLAGLLALALGLALCVPAHAACQTDGCSADCPMAALVTHHAVPPVACDAWYASPVLAVPCNCGTRTFALTTGRAADTSQTDAGRPSSAPLQAAAAAIQGGRLLLPLAGPADASQPQRPKSPTVPACPSLRAPPPA